MNNNMQAGTIHRVNYFASVRPNVTQAEICNSVGTLESGNSAIVIHTGSDDVGL